MCDGSEGRCVYVCVFVGNVFVGVGVTAATGSWGSATFHPAISHRHPSNHIVTRTTSQAP